MKLDAVERPDGSAEAGNTESGAVDPAAVNIGARLRHARLTKRLSLKDVSAAVGCSEGFLSKVENDKVKPSLASLHRIVAVLGINITTLFANADAQEQVFISRRSAREQSRGSHAQMGIGVSLEALLPFAPGMLLQVGIHNIDPRGRSDGMISHEGEEAGFILAGELELVVEENIYRLGEGDCFFFKSHLTHGYRNPGDREARVLWVNTPPTF